LNVLARRGQLERVAHGIHVAVPDSYRTHRDIPEPYVLQHEDLDGADEANFEGIPVVAPAKAFVRFMPGTRARLAA
jgi:hypothetical protein